MYFTRLMLVSFCGLTLAQNVANETAISGGTLSCFPETSAFLLQLGAVKNKLEGVELRLKESETQVLELKLKELEVKKKLEAMETRLKESENQVLDLTQKASRVIFSAAMGGNGALGPFNTVKTLIFSTVITNVGNAYNQFTGIFVAPVSGIYYFSFFYHAGGYNPTSLALMKNNQAVVVSSNQKTSHDPTNNGGNAAFVQLVQGDQVHISMYANNHIWAYGTCTTFSGFLLHQV